MDGFKEEQEVHFEVAYKKYINSDATEEELTAARQSQHGIFVQPTAADLQRAQESYDEVAAVHEIVKGFERQAAELADIMVRISETVDSNSERIDSIETWVGQGVEMVKAGNEQLQEANRIKKARYAEPRLLPAPVAHGTNGP